MTETTTKTVYYTATTLDGYIADPVDSLDWLFVRVTVSAAQERVRGFVAAHPRLSPLSRREALRHLTARGDDPDVVSPWMLGSVFDTRTRPPGPLQRQAA